MPAQLSNHQITPLSKDLNAKKQLGEALAMIFDTQQTFGKDPEQMNNLTKLFLFTLADYPYESISKALRFFIKHNNSMPTPSDIVNIIERNGKPPFEKSVYITLMKKQGYERTSEEWEYIRDYERWIIRGQYK